MKKQIWKWIKAMIFVIWCTVTPQLLFVDCIHPVIDQTREIEGIEKEDYIRMFRLDRSDYKITLKYDIRKWLLHQ